MKHFLHEPLLHFLLLGAGLFAVYEWIGGSPVGEGERIVLTQGRIEQLAHGFARMHQRAPDRTELYSLIDDAVREEIYYREAKALALDEDDTIVRRRLRQKLEFVSEDVAPVDEPNEVQLQAYLQTHLEKFRTPLRYSIQHVYLNPERRGLQLDLEARRLLADLRHAGADADPTGIGDAFLLGHRFDDMPADELTRLFGPDFTSRLHTSLPDHWFGPVASGYGMHLVRVLRRNDDRAPSLASVRDAVRAEWLRAQRLEANERFYAELRKRYAVTVEWPKEYASEFAQLASTWP